LVGLAPTDPALAIPPAVPGFTGIWYSSDVESGGAPANGWARQAFPGSGVPFQSRRFGRSNVTAFDIDASVEVYSFDHADFFGGVNYLPGDVVQFDLNTFTYSLRLDSRALGVPVGVGVDAVALLSNGDLAISFDSAVGGFTSSDILSVGPGGIFMIFNSQGPGAGAGGFGFDLPDGLNVDGFDLDEVTGLLYFSFDSDGVIDGIPFHDDWVLSFRPDPGPEPQWRVEFTPSIVDPTSWLPADLDAFAIANDAVSDDVFKDGFE
jgi:hypothetical protein